MRPGPPIALLMKANVTVPDLSLSETALDFADVLVGKGSPPLPIPSGGQRLPSPPHSSILPDEATYKAAHPSQTRQPTPHRQGSPPLTDKATHHIPSPQVGRARTMTILLTNPKEVVAEWAMKRPIEGAKDFGFFHCEPSHGTLAPGSHVAVEVTFTPSSERAYSVALNFKAANNNRALTLNVQGTGKELKLVVSPEHISLPAVLPYAAAATAPFTLHNPTDYPIEVYCVELDEQYVLEEAMLREAEGFVGDVITLAPREPGQGMWSEVVEASEAKAAQRAAEARAVEGGGEEGDVEDGTADPVADSAVGELEPPVEQAPPPPRKLFLLLGAPLSGVGAQGHLLGANFGLPVVSLNDVLRSAAEARAATEAAAAVNAALDPADPKAPPPGDVDPEASAEEVEAAFARPLDPEALLAAVRGALSAQAKPAGAVVVFPEQAVPHAELPALVDVVVSVLEGDVATPHNRWAPHHPPPTLRWIVLDRVWEGWVGSGLGGLGRIGFGRVGSDRVWEGWVGSGLGGLGRIGFGRVGSGWVWEGWVGSGLGGLGRIGFGRVGSGWVWEGWVGLGLGGLGRIGFGRVGSDRVWEGWVGSGLGGLGRIGFGRVGSDRVWEGWVGSGLGGLGRIGFGRVGSDRVWEGWVGSGLGGLGRVGSGWVRLYICRDHM